MTLDAGTEQTMRRQVALWRDHLLDLTRRQKLLYFRHVGVASLEIGQPAASEVLAHVDSGNALLLADGLGLNVANKTEDQLPGATRRLAQVAQQVFADRGVWTLYLGLGMLHWRDPADGRDVDSPLVLVPVRLTRSASNLPYAVTRAEEEVVLNPALVLKLERDFGLRLPVVEDFSLDLPKYLDEVADLVADHDGWTVSQRTVLTTFTFLKEAIYRDLVDNETAIVDHPLVQLVALGPAAPAAKELPFEPLDDAVNLDEVVPPETLHSILDADSSQRRCILAAREGRSFVMDGPPGTGKSQTIANIIAELMAMGRSVLFVSEKAAALDVVQSRLENRGLGNFLLELHSHTAGRREVADALNKELTSRPVARSAFDSGAQESLVAARRRLSDYAAAVNEVRPGLGLTLHTVIGQAALLRGNESHGTVSADVGRALTATRRTEITSAAERLARSWRPVTEGEDFLWRGVSVTSADSATLDRLSSVVVGARAAAQTLTARTRAVDENLPLGLPNDLPGVRRRAELLDLLSQAPGEVPSMWFSAPELDGVQQRLARVEHLVTAYRDAADAAREQLGSGWTDLDPDAAEVLDRAATTTDVWRLPTDVPGPRLHDLHRLALGLPERAVAVLDDARRLAPRLGLRADRISLARAGEIARLALLAETATPLEAGWLNPTVHAALADSRRVLEQLVGVVRQRHDVVASVFTRAALDLDLVGLRTRFHETHRGLRRFSGTARADKKLLKSVTVAQRVTKETIAALDEAIAWQQAERELAREELDHAGRLGSYYRGTETDFGRLAAAVEAALEAVRLAGAELDARALAGQLSRDAAPDPQLSLTAHRLDDAVRRLTGDLDADAGDASPMLQALSLEDLAAAAAQLVTVLGSVLPVVDGVQEVAGRELTLAECRRGLAAVGTAVGAQSDVLDAYETDVNLLGPGYVGTDTDLEALKSAVAFCADVRRLTGGPVAPSVAVHLTRPALTATEVQQPVDAFVRAVEALCGQFAADRGRELRADLEASVPAADAELTGLLESLPRDVPEWCAHVDRRAELTELGLGSVVDTLAASGAAADRVAPAVEGAALVAWIDEVVRTDPRLQEYRSDDRDALVERFRRLDADLVQNAHAAVVAACNEMRPKTVLGDASHIRREAEKKTRHIPVRELLTRSGTVAQKLKPCFMMSPLAVSQYLPPSLRFDVVIFDEASQVAPWDAVNCIYRGDQLIVAGDEKQLPPTSFFDAAQEELDDSEADELLEEFESVLKACKGAGAMTALPLSWHYRSRHEDLITFSNVTFYEGRLNTFPGARFEAEDLGVVSYLVPGVYDRGGRRDNVVEARQVVDRVVHHYRTNPTLSVGVVTLSVAQADAVERELERRAEEDRSLEPLLERGDRLGGFFVKNLENVQGDERDVIIFSTGYGPDENGKITMNFGPLTRKGGWRRLNVAVTRARRRVEVVTSLQHGQIAAGTNESHAALRDYLHFAAKGPQALAVDLGGSLGDAESPFEEDVLSVIRSLGYEAVPQVGTAGYRIDLGVKHPTIPGEYVLGVECDGAAYHSAKAARDRDRLRQSVLEGLGWRIHRIWGISWWRDRRGQVERLRAAIEDAVRGGPPAPATAPVVVPEVVVEEFDVNARPEWAQPYERYRSRHRDSAHELHTVEARPQIRSWVEGLLAIEAPIHEDLLLERFREDFSTRLGARIRTNVLDVLSRAQPDGQPAQRTTKGFWSHRKLDVVRVPVDESTFRAVEHVPPAEVRTAVSRLVGDAGSVPPGDLVDAVRRTFRWARATPEVVAVVETEVEFLVARGELQRAGDRLRSTPQH